MLKIDKIRRQRGLTVTTLAIKTGLADCVVSKVLRGSVPPYPKYRDKLAEALDWKGDPLELFEEVQDGDEK